MVRDVLDWKRGKGIHHVLLVLDNAPVHSRVKLIELQQQFPNFKFSFLPIYSPELNLCEFFFSALKKKIQSKLFRLNQCDMQEWHDKVEEIADTVQFPHQNTLEHIETLCDDMISSNGSLSLALKARSDRMNLRHASLFS
jgi:hypothetical protein